jgi:broad specificity phosphatase PhoE
MEVLTPRHLVLVRHGESEGDVRRKQKLPALKHPIHEEQTKVGHEQSRAAGSWITKHILGAYGLNGFDNYLVSPLIRTKQSADSLDLSDTWVEDPRLAERNRGDIQGVTNKQHMERYAESYKQMLEHPFHWVPPHGESILAVSHRFGELVNDLVNTSNVLIMTHRDVIWAALVPLEGMDLEEAESVNTDTINNGQVIHYTNVNPSTGVAESLELIWKRSVDPSASNIPVENVEWLNVSDLRESLV